jgi:hypothetical protein
MRRSVIAAAATAIALTLAAALPEFGWAQSPALPSPPNGFKPPPPAPVKPYAAVAVAPPSALNDPSFVAFRLNLADVAKRKDRDALAKLVVAQEFFWIQDKDLADKNRPGIDNLAKAVDLDAKDGSGWDIIGGYAAEPTASASPDHKGAMCAPSDPAIDPKALEALVQATQTSPSEWGYPLGDGTELHAAAQADSPVTDKLGLYLVRVLPDSAPPDNPGAQAFLHVALPSGKTGYIAAETLAPLGSDQMCYVKGDGGWKIAGYMGGVVP